MNALYETTPISTQEELHQLLQSLCDTKYREFHAALVPGLDDFLWGAHPGAEKIGVCPVKIRPLGLPRGVPGPEL